MPVQGTAKLCARPSGDGNRPRVTCCGGEEPRKGHAAFTYRLNQITEGIDNLRDHVVSEHYNVALVLRWQLKDATRSTAVSPAMSARRDGLTALGR